jgi:hypothetical protein
LRYPKSLVKLAAIFRYKSLSRTVEAFVDSTALREKTKNVEESRETIPKYEGTVDVDTDG